MRDIRDLVTHINSVKSNLAGVDTRLSDVKTYFDNRFDAVYDDIRELKQGLIIINQKLNQIINKLNP